MSGGLLVVDWNERNAHKDEGYALFYSHHNGGIYRCEYLPWGLFEVPINPDNNGSFNLRLPKIPKSLLWQAYSFFGTVYSRYGTESALQLFWDTDDKSYYWYVPQQWAGETTVHYERNPQLEYRHWLIADMHSHGHFRPYFSCVDNADEKGTRLYGVIGNLDTNPQFMLRAGSGGFFVEIDVDDIFGEECNADYEELPINRVVPLL